LHDIFYIYIYGFAYMNKLGNQSIPTSAWPASIPIVPV